MQLCCDEKRLILGISVSLSEQEKQWRAFLQSLVDRGVKGAELIISDAHVGLQAVRKAIFNAPDREQAEALLRKTIEKYAQCVSRLADWMEGNIPGGLTVFDFPVHHQRRIRTVNSLERISQKIRQRTRVARIFPNEASCLRVVSAIVMETSETWETGKVNLSFGRFD